MNIASYLFAFLIILSPILGDGFSNHLKSIKKQIINEKILTPKEANSLFKKIKFSKKVIAQNKKQTHKRLKFETYLEKVISKTKINKANEVQKRYKVILDKIENKFKVDKRVITALWGVETFFGKYTGKDDIVDSLSTLSYTAKSKRRRDFFRKELIYAIKIIKNQNIKKKNFLGSWAGAMGQCQFMPSSYIAYAVDFNGDGFKDIWNTKSDIFASIANYLKSNKYKYKEPINYIIKPKDFRIIKKFKDKKLSIAYLRRQGISIDKSIDNRLKAKVVHIKYSTYKNGSYILAFDNHYVIRKWNIPISFITSVSLLSKKY